MMHLNVRILFAHNLLVWPSTKRTVVLFQSPVNYFNLFKKFYLQNMAISYQEEYQMEFLDPTAIMCVVFLLFLCKVFKE